MAEQLPAWPRDTTYVHVSPKHVTAGKPGSLTESAAALAVAEAIGEGVATVAVDVDLITAHERKAPFRWWVAETPEVVTEWTAALDGWECDGDVAAAARLGILDFSLTWREGNLDEAAAAAGKD